MPEVTGYTTDKVDALIANSVVGANIDPGTGVLTLTLHDGTTVNVGSVLTAVPAATTAVSGKVELATDVETQAGTDTTRAVTPFGLAAVIATTAAKGIVELATNAETLTGTDAVRAVTPAGLASIPGVKILAADPGENAVPTAYPLGTSMLKMSVASATPWTINSGVGAVITFNQDNSTAQQTFYANFGGTTTPRYWMREYHPSNGGGGWTPWGEVLLGRSIGGLAVGDVLSYYGTGINAWSNRSLSSQASSLGSAGMPVVYYNSGSGYAFVAGPAIYVGTVDPAGSFTVANGSVWLDTTGT